MTDQGEKPRKRVWVLGAGFSRSLGGPLMFDLLSIAAWRQVLALYKDQIHKDEADLVFWMFHYGSKFPEGPLDSDITGYGERRWQDAEQFLEILDSASTGDPYARAAVDEMWEGLLKRTNAPTHLPATRYPGAFARKALPRYDELAKMAKRMVAASCCAFLNGVTPQSVRDGKERWIPYMEWMSWLKAEDTILTFNYDLVVEMLQPKGEGWGVHVAGYGDDFLGRAKRIPTLYKLHGSVNWQHEPDGRVTTPEWTPAMLGSAFNLAIATPGDSKMKLAGSLFGRLWEPAATKLREAEEVYIIGFRFPQGDAYPRDQLLGALRENKTRDLAVHVILGPDRSPDQARVLALLQWTLGVRATHDPHVRIEGRSLSAQSMWAEDFLNVWAGRNRAW